eukprot:15169270-Heterocapsa_arctica.AAC.1
MMNLYAMEGKTLSRALDRPIRDERWQKSLISGLIGMCKHTMSRDALGRDDAYQLAWSRGAEIQGESARAAGGG